MTASTADPAGLAARHRPRRLRTVIGALAAVIMLSLGGVSVAQPFLSPRETQGGTVFWSGYQILHHRTSQNGPFVDTKIPIVKVRLDDGTVHTVESTPLFNLFGAAPRDLNVRVQQDQNGVPKRIEYHGRWYGAGPPIWFWLGFGLLLLAGSGFLGRGTARRMRTARLPAAG
jgi:hypothetical protein